jgi:hypothetical protein
MAEPKDDRRDENLSWNRVGQFLESTGAVGTSVWQRNVDLWNGVSRRMRDDDRYTADDVAKDVAKTMSVAMDNLDDMWSLWTRVPERERVAAALPTVFLFFDRMGRGGEHALVDPVLIRLPATQTADLPERAEIVLGGQSTRGGAARARTSDEETPADKLLRSLRARLDKAQGYWVETIADEPKVAALVAGAYDGFVYLTKPARPLASLRVVVEGPPPEV